MIELLRLQRGDEELARAAATLFKHTSPSPECEQRLLSDDRNYIIVARDQDRLAGFLIAYELPRWDMDRPMMCLYELGVDECYQRRGIGRALVEELLRHSRQRSCITMWVITEADNAPAIALYESTGGIPDQHGGDVVFTYHL